MRLRYKIGELFRNVKYMCERAVKGYSSLDTWNIDTWFLKTMPKLLREQASFTISWPGEGRYPEIKTFEDWKNQLNYIAKLLEDAAQDPLDFYDWRAKSDEIEQKKNEALDLIKKYFWDLWD